MTVRRLLRLVRDSQTGNAGTLHCPLPLAAESQAMKSLVATCEFFAKNGQGIALQALAGDLLEAPSLFRHLVNKLGIQEFAVIPPGKERLTLLQEDRIGLEAVFFPNASQVAFGVQSYIVEELAPRVRLAIFCLPEQKNIDTAGFLCPDLLDYCGRSIIKWPNWTERALDHDKTIFSLISWLEKDVGIICEMDDGVWQYIKSRNWRSVGHLAAAMMRLREKAANQKIAGCGFFRIRLDDMEAAPDSDRAARVLSSAGKSRV